MSDTLSHSSQTRNQTYRAQWGIGFILLAVVVYVWRGAGNGDFHFDDHSNIVNNERIHTLWPIESFLENNRPMGQYTFALNYHFCELDPIPYRSTNILIHIVNVVLLFAGVLMTARIVQSQSDPGRVGPFQSFSLAAITALIWGIHPLTTQAVTYIVQRYESLSAMGYLGAWVGLLSYLTGQLRNSAGVRVVGLIMILIFSWIGLLSKEVFATAPVVILLLDRQITEQRWLTVFRTRWPAYLVMITPFIWFIPTVSRWLDPARPSSGMGFGLKIVSWWEYLRTQPEVIFHYLRLSIWPDKLCFDYRWHVQGNPWVYLSLGAAILAILSLGLWLYTGILKQNGDRQQSSSRGVAGWHILAFFFILAPTSSILPIRDLCVEHRVYLPLAVVVSGGCLLGSQLLRLLISQARRPAVVRIGFSLILFAGLMLLGWRTHLRNRDYQTGIKLWSATVNVNPRNVRAWAMLASYYYAHNRTEEALILYEHADRIPGEAGVVHAGMAHCLRDLGQLKRAEQHYLKAIKVKPTLAEAYNGLGVVYHRRGDRLAERDAFQQAYDLGLPEACYNLANVHLLLGERRTALSFLEESLSIDPTASLAAQRLAWVLATAPEDQLRDATRARKLLTKHFAIKKSDSPYVWDTHAAVLAEERQFKKATVAAMHALNLAAPRKDNELTSAIQQRIASYQQQEPWRDEDVNNHEGRKGESRER